MTRRPPKPTNRPASPRFKIPTLEKMDFQKEFGPFLASFQNSNVFRENDFDDTTIAIIATNFLDELLKFAIIARLRKHPTTSEMAELTSLISRVACS